MKKPVTKNIPLDALTPTQNDIRFTIRDLLKQITRPGVEQIMEMLDQTDFYLAPASTQYHGAYDGGLAYHSLMVCEAALTLYKDFYPNLFEQTEWLSEVSEESIILASLLHDVCKIDTYVPGFRNQKNDATGQWEKIATYKKEPQLSMGHGGKSVYILQKYIDLTEQEAAAIFWHMGGYDISNYMTLNELGETYEKNFLAFLLHQADMMTTYVLENNRYFQTR